MILQLHAGANELIRLPGYTYAFRDFPGPAPICEDQYLVGTDALLAVAGAHRQAQSFCDDGAEVRKLLYLLDRQRRIRVGDGVTEFVFDFLQDGRVAEEMESYDLCSTIDEYV